MTTEPWTEYRLFALDDMVESAIRPHPMITMLVGPIAREQAEKVMIPYWISCSRLVYAFERDTCPSLVDVGGES